MKVQQMLGRTRKPIANQFIIHGASIEMPDDTYQGTAFQSYNSLIALKAYHCNNTGNCDKVFLDRDTWDYSRTTAKYRNQFLGENKDVTQAKIDSGEYILTDLN